MLAAPSSVARPDSCAKLQPKLAASFTKAVYEAVKEIKVGPAGSGWVATQLAS